MNFIQSLHLIDTSELVLIAVCCYVITQAIKESMIQIANEYLPFLSMIIGVLVGIVIALIFHDYDLGKYGLAGFLVGGWTSGIFTGIKGVTDKYTK